MEQADYSLANARSQAPSQPPTKPELPADKTHTKPKASTLESLEIDLRRKQLYVEIENDICAEEEIGVPSSYRSQSSTLSDMSIAKRETQYG